LGQGHFGNFRPENEKNGRTPHYGGFAVITPEQEIIFVSQVKGDFLILLYRDFHQYIFPTGGKREVHSAMGKRLDANSLHIRAYEAE
jgi:hypothetical protein